jgi:hypothetical protein
MQKRGPTQQGAERPMGGERKREKKVDNGMTKQITPGHYHCPLIEV